MEENKCLRLCAIGRGRALGKQGAAGRESRQLDCD
jgi:hypothetical protein